MFFLWQFLAWFECVLPPGAVSRGVRGGDWAPPAMVMVRMGGVGWHMVVVMVHWAGVGLGGLAVALVGWFIVIITVFAMSSVAFLSSSSSVAFSSSSLLQHLPYPVIISFATATVIVIIIAMTIVIVTATVTPVTFLVTMT